MDRGAWWAADHGVAKSQTRLSDFTFTFHFHFSLSCIGEGNGTPLQHSCLENPRDSRAWWAAVSGVAQSRTRLKRRSSSNSSSRLVIAFLPRSKHLLISWLQSPSAVILEPLEIKWTINVMYLNHPTPSVEKLSSMKLVPRAKNVGDCCCKVACP